MGGLRMTDDTNTNILETIAFLSKDIQRMSDDFRDRVTSLEEALNNAHVTVSARVEVCQADVIEEGVPGSWFLAWNRSKDPNQSSVRRWMLEVSCSNDKGEFKARQPLLSASRDLRTLAVQVLPALLTALHVRLVECVRDHEEALRVFSELGIEPKKEPAS
jgi:hypothetical protein